MDAFHLTPDELEAGLTWIRQSPAVEGVIDMIVRRPSSGGREVIDHCELLAGRGLVGDAWGLRAARLRPGETLRTHNEITLMNARVISLVARERARWSLAGDQFFVDLDLSEALVPPETRLALGDAVVEVTESPHLGCRKFKQRFGTVALEFVNSDLGRQLRLRGVNARIVQTGMVRKGDCVRNLGRA